MAILVQRGTATMTSGETSDTITFGTAVTMVNAFVIVQPNIDSPVAGQVHITFQLASTTTFTVKRNTSGTALSYTWQVIESDAITVERGTIDDIPSGSNQTITLANQAFDLSKLFHISTIRAPGNSWNEDDFWRTDLLDDAGTLKMRLRTSDWQNLVVMEYQIIEYAACSVQRGSIGMPGTTSETASITAVAALNKAFVLISYDADIAAGEVSNMDQYMCRGRLTTTSEVTIDRKTANNTIRCNYEVVEFTDGSIVQHVDVAMISTTIAASKTLSGFTTLAAMWCSIPGQNHGAGITNQTADDNPGSVFTMAEITSLTNMDVDRVLHASSTLDARIEVIELIDGSGEPGVTVTPLAMNHYRRRRAG